MDAVVQLIRNGLCCIKDLEWFQDTFPSLWDSNIFPQYYDIPAPYNQTTPLDAMIGVTQFYASVSMTTSGWTLMHTSYGKMRRIQRLKQALADKNEKDTDADRLIQASLVKEAMYAARSMFIGFLVMSIGIAFFWLFANSFKVTQTSLLGGVPGLIHALTVTEVGLLPLLYYMWIDSGEQLKRAARLEKLANEMKELKDRRLNAADIDLPSFEALTEWLPFWDSGVSAFETSIPESAVEEKLVLEEKFKIQKSLDQFTTEKAKIVVLQDKANELLAASRVARLEGYREFLYFILNSIAFYSYMFCVLVFYFDKEETKPETVRSLMFYLDNESADWHGNFWGDLMWTIEPVIILSTPMIFASIKNAAKQKSKAKSD
mmetsp:Transcript_14873/g.30658  ORF Transcript_14873/g.30658 Transcript_14873/m.30658 type:complete len:375 (-) Transcript_14873:129-1253(-)